MIKRPYDPRQLEELLLQGLQTEVGGIDIYTAALECAIHEDLRREWEKYLHETLAHRDVLTNVMTELGMDPGRSSPGREVVAHNGRSLVQAIKLARATDTAAAAQIVAAECVVLAETKDHQNWELIGHLVETSAGDAIHLLAEAYAAVEHEEDHHLYHTKGWTRELWIQSLGLPAALPPPEELRDVETAIGAAHAKEARAEMLQGTSEHVVGS